MLARWGGVDIIVNVDGDSSASSGSYAVLDDARWLEELNQNLMPAAQLDHAFLPSTLAQGSGDCSGQFHSTDAATVLCSTLLLLNLLDGSDKTLHCCVNIVVVNKFSCTRDETACKCVVGFGRLFRFFCQKFRY